MNISKTAAILSLFTAVALSFGCGEGTNSNVMKSNRPGPAANGAEKPNSPRTNVEELGLHVKVAYEVEDVVWIENPGKRSLMAVLRFSPADAAKVVGEASQFGQPQAGSISPESWFPDELIAQAEMSGDRVLKGQVYPANSFLQEPYVTGKLTRIEGTDYFVLEASAN